MNGFRGWIMVTAVLVGATYFTVAARTPADVAGDKNWNAVAKLPVVDRGRVKPLDTVARTSLMVISGGRQEIPMPKGGPKPAIVWLIEAMAAESPMEGPAAELPIFRIDNDQLLSVLGLENRPGSFRYSIKDIQPKFDVLDREISRAQGKDPKSRDLFDERVLELSRRLKLYLDLVQHNDPLLLPPTVTVKEWRSLGAVETEIGRAVADGFRERIKKEGLDFEKMNREQRDAILNAAAAQIDKQLAAASPAASVWRALFSAQRTNNAERFNQSVAELARMTADEPFMAKVRFEKWFNHFMPFYHCSVLYVGVFILVCLSWMAAPSLGRAAFGLALIVLFVHTGALIGRMWIQERPPVTNLYSSAVFIGWGAVALALVLEWFYRNGIGTAVAAVTGFSTLLIAHHLGTSGDTLEMMQAVLDTNFWLATHVTTVTLGYTATFVAGFLGIAYILFGLALPLFDRDGLKKISRMTYGVICFALLLSFVGTVLGGIWADQSWGRFWGWDPKENGAVLIVLWNAMILHARWGGMVKDRGIAVMAVFGNIVTAWSWFGTNQLGVGLHSYGFTSGVAMTMVLFDVAMLLVMALGMIPTKYWVVNRMKIAPVNNPAMTLGPR